MNCSNVRCRGRRPIAASGPTGMPTPRAGVFAEAGQAPPTEAEKERKCHVVAKFPKRRSAGPEVRIGRLSKFMNVIMESGKKAVAERIIYGALDQVEKKAGKDPLGGLHGRHQQRRRWSR